MKDVENLSSVAVMNRTLRIDTIELFTVEKTGDLNSEILFLVYVSVSELAYDFKTSATILELSMQLLDINGKYLSRVGSLS